MPARAKLAVMSVPLGQLWTQEQFFAWAEAQEMRYEFDGLQPVAMTGGNIRHSTIALNVRAALRYRLRGSGCRPLGPDAGVQTVNRAVRYPDALVSCSKLRDEDRVVPGVVVVFEVISPTSGRVDRIVKLGEYAAVPSIRRYVTLESTSSDIIVMERTAPDETRRTTALTGDGILRMPEIDIEIPVSEFYDDIAFPEAGEVSAG